MAGTSLDTRPTGQTEFGNTESPVCDNEAAVINGLLSWEGMRVFLCSNINIHPVLIISLDMKNKSMSPPRNLQENGFLLISQVNKFK